MFENEFGIGETCLWLGGIVDFVDGPLWDGMALGVISSKKNDSDVAPTVAERHLSIFNQRKANWLAWSPKAALQF